MSRTDDEASRRNPRSLTPVTVWVAWEVWHCQELLQEDRWGDGVTSSPHRCCCPGNRSVCSRLGSAQGLCHHDTARLTWTLCEDHIINVHSAHTVRESFSVFSFLQQRS